MTTLLTFLFGELTKEEATRKTPPRIVHKEGFNEWYHYLITVKR